MLVILVACLLGFQGASTALLQSELLIAYNATCTVVIGFVVSHRCPAAWSRCISWHGSGADGHPWCTACGTLPLPATTVTSSRLAPSTHMCECEDRLQHVLHMLRGWGECASAGVDSYARPHQLDSAGCCTEDICTRRIHCG